MPLLTTSRHVQESSEGIWVDQTGEDLNVLYLGKFEKCQPSFFQIDISLYENGIQLENVPQFFGHDFANETLALPN